MHEGHEPDALVGLLDADVLAGEDGAEVDLAFAKADTATVVTVGAAVQGSASSPSPR